MSTFTATHCGQTFTGLEGAAELAAHMKSHKGAHGVGRTATLTPPRPWTAPRRTKGGLEKVLADAAAGKYGQDHLDITAPEPIEDEAPAGRGLVFENLDDLLVALTVAAMQDA